jgi:hypothetical protein
LDDLDFILSILVEERTEYSKLNIPSNLVGKRRLMRSLMNVRPVQEVSTQFLKSQDEELQKQLLEKGIID